MRTRIERYCGKRQFSTVGTNVTINLSVDRINSTIKYRYSNDGKTSSRVNFRPDSRSCDHQEGLSSLREDNEFLETDIHESETTKRLIFVPPKITYVTPLGVQLR